MNIKRCSTCGMITNDTCGNPKCDIPLEVPLFAKRSTEDNEESPSEYKTMSDKIARHHDSTVFERKKIISEAVEIVMEENKSKKFDQGKPRLSLIPRSALIAAGEVLSFGAKKYDPHNWRKSGFD